MAGAPAADGTSRPALSVSSGESRWLFGLISGGRRQSYQVGVQWRGDLGDVSLPHNADAAHRDSHRLPGPGAGRLAAKAVGHLDLPCAIPARDLGSAGHRGEPEGPGPVTVTVTR